jgi:hypothetical protein
MDRNISLSWSYPDDVATASGPTTTTTTTTTTTSTTDAGQSTANRRSANSKRSERLSLLKLMSITTEMAQQRDITTENDSILFASKKEITTKCLSFQSENKNMSKIGQLSFTQQQGEDSKSTIAKSRIPKKIHIADYNSCPSNNDFQTIWQSWKQLDDFDVYFHSPHQMNAFFHQDWPEFPHLQSIVNSCIPNFGSYFDLWKSLILWEFGGAVVDYAWVPTINFTTTLIQPSDQVYLLEPRHPLAYYLVLQILNTIQSLATLQDLFLRSPRPTGQFAFSHVVMLFTMADRGIKFKVTGLYRAPEDGYRLTTYPGRYNRTIRMEDMRSFLSPSLLRKSHIRKYYQNSQAILDHEQHWNVSCMKQRWDYVWKYVSPWQENIQ